MSLLDTVEPDFVWHKPKSGDPDGEIIEEKLYRETTVESLLTEHSKQVLLKAASAIKKMRTETGWIGKDEAERLLRRMAFEPIGNDLEGEKE